jgi:hypothetical protein
MTGQAAGSTDLTPFAVGMPHIPGGDAHQDEGRDHKDQVKGIKEKHGSFLSK